MSLSQLPRVIALSGWRGSGKDTTANYLVEEYGYRQASFAAKLKDEVASRYGVPREYLDSPTKKEIPLTTYPVITTDAFSEAMHLLLRAELSSNYWTPRALCIALGSLQRSIDPNYWVRSVAQEIIRNQIPYVVSDMRYKSEADTLRALIPDLVTVRINRFPDIATTEASERDLDDYKFDYSLDNTGTMEQLREQIDSLIVSLDGPRAVSVSSGK
jgi:hypothetical protein